ncbi:signal-induced proliferation-associated protein 1 isoform X1 [Prionailurus viverrinus]|uniref:signal-induced proliferation-associated protein 1 isoform X1 n=1 Tax=Prionailurus bengalensis TaxID=37029 RepID=UPI001CA903CC|nr:signal-induced proliferation-associated protein 1 isoform X1 [Prionailurus bengalensis]XP_047733958.1 signal-induced proliferation-associated protein 1 isoform X1 [Prionailurus viverrinus]
MWAGGVGSPRRGPAPAPTDDLFARKLRQPARPPLTPHTFEPRPARGPLLRSGSDAGEARPPTPASPRARAHSHEEASRPAATPTRLFTDPLALLGLPAEEPEPAFPPVPEPHWFAHYDVQSLLFDWVPRPRGTGGHAEAGSGTPASAEDLSASSDLLLEAPGFVSELGGEGELGLGGPASPPVPPALPNAAVSILEEPQNRTSAYSLEHADLGAGYYRKYFYGKEHQNFFGLDEVLGPVAVSLRREEKEGSGGGTLHSYRVIVRTTQLRTLRGTISEDALPPGPPRGLSPRKLLEHVAPRLSPTCLRLGSASPKVPRTLLTLDEQVLSFQRKVGILYCRAGQGSEEEMYNNQEAGPAFTQFLTLLGDVVRLKGFESYRAQLDTKTDSTGTHSLYTTYQDHEIMFHVSTMLPYTPNNQQQLLRKRHIGNDIVTIVFQEPGSKPFCPATIRSHFQHIFLVVRAHAPCTPHTSYRVAVSRTQDTPAFGPSLPQGGGPFPANADFRAFLLAKALNGEQAAGHARQFHAMATRTRQQYLQDLATNEVTTTSLDSASRFGLPSLGGRRRAPPRGPGSELQAAGALVWAVRAAPGARGAAGAEARGPDDAEVPCLLGISAETLVLVAPRDGRVVFNCACRDVLAWTFSEQRLDLYHGRGEAITLRFDGPPGHAVGEVVARLQLVSRGCETLELALPREGQGRLGFEVDAEGFITHVERFTFAETTGLRPGARLLRVCGQPLPRLGPEAAAQLLRSAPKVCVTVLPPDESGRPRRSFSELYTLSLQEPSRRGAPEPVQDEAPGAATLQPTTQQLLQACLLEGGSSTGPGDLAEERTEFLHSQDSPSPRSSLSDEAPVLPNTTPDLLLAATAKPSAPSAGRETPPTRVSKNKTRAQRAVVGTVGSVDVTASVPINTPQDGPGSPSGCEDRGDPAPELRASFLPRTLSLRNSISKIMSEAGSETLEDEWQSISEIASTCNTILESLSREDGPSVPTGQPIPESGDAKGTPKSDAEPEPGNLSEKVSRLESMLRKLQEDLQKEKADKAALEEEVRSLRHNNRRLQAESESAATRLLLASKQLGSPTADLD